jgi:hypothetical protein
VWAVLASPRREQQFGRVWERVVAVGTRWKVNQFVGVGAVSIGKPLRSEVDHPGIMERDHGQYRQVRGYRHSDGATAAESRSRGLKTNEHGNT